MSSVWVVCTCGSIVCIDDVELDVKTWPRYNARYTGFQTTDVRVVLKAAQLGIKGIMVLMVLKAVQLGIKGIMVLKVLQLGNEGIMVLLVLKAAQLESAIVVIDHVYIFIIVIILSY